MREGWKEVRLDNIARVIMGLSPKGETYNNEGVGIPLLNGPTEFGETYPNCTLYTTDPKRICKRGDLIFCVRGSTTGRMNWADKPYALGRGVCSITGFDDLTTKFTKHLLTINLPALLQITGGGTFPNLRKEDINGFKFRIPKNYRKIATILSAYDDLIENNLKRIQLLEEKAQLTYEEWFVRLKFPGHETTPMDEETGLPVGWERVKIGDVSEYIGRGISPKYVETDGVPVVNQKCIRGFKVNMALTRLSSRSKKIGPDKVLRSFDVLVNSTGTGTLGRVAQIISVPEFMTVDTHVTIIRGVGNISPIFLGRVLEYNQPRIENLGKGATNQIELSRHDLGRLEILLPPRKLQNEFDMLYRPNFHVIDDLLGQNQLLKEARDLLLPRLMTGLIDVAAVAGQDVAD